MFLTSSFPVLYFNAWRRPGACVTHPNMDDLEISRTCGVTDQESAERAI